MPLKPKGAIISGVAAERLRRVRAGRTVDVPGLMEFIPGVLPHYAPPEHLREVIEALEAMDKEPQNVVIHAPPRHGKTETILMAIARRLKRNPRGRFGYTSYSAELAEEKSALARDYAQMCGVEISSATRAKNLWRTTSGGGVKAAGVGGGLTGFGADEIIVIDDPFKNRAEAESAVMRKRVQEWFTDVVFTRREPGVSVVVIMTRWHPGDLSGWLIGEKKWRYIKLPAVDDAGAALWPERFPRSELDEIRETIGEYSWASLYQGVPRDRGGSVFGDAHLYDELPDLAGARIGIGVDLAYSTKSASDWSVYVEMMLHSGLYYVTNVLRRQVRAPDWKRELRALRERRPNARMRAILGGTEIGIGDFMNEGAEGVRLDVKMAKGDKFTRAQPFAAAWNTGKVLIPHAAPWVDPYCAELAAFTGVNDEHDDQVDASVGGYDILAPNSDMDRFRKLAAM